jgi:hypothetical protein
MAVPDIRGQRAKKLRRRGLWEKASDIVHSALRLYHREVRGNVTWPYIAYWKAKRAGISRIKGPKLAMAALSEQILTDETCHFPLRAERIKPAGQPAVAPPVRAKLKRGGCLIMTPSFRARRMTACGGRLRAKEILTLDAPAAASCRNLASSSALQTPLIGRRIVRLNADELHCTNLPGRRTPDRARLRIALSTSLSKATTR